MRFVDDETPDLTIDVRSARPSIVRPLTTPTFLEGARSPTGVGRSRGGSRGGASSAASPADFGGGGDTYHQAASSYRAPSTARSTSSTRGQNQLIAGYYSLEPEDDDERQLIEQLRDRVRGLQTELQESEIRRRDAAREADDTVRMVRYETAKGIEKYKGERDRLQERIEDLRRRFNEIDKDDYDVIKERLEKLEIVSRDGWEQVAVKNIKLQKLRKRVEGLQGQCVVERVAKESAQRLRDKALAKLQPLRDKNLQMEYRLSLQHNLYAGASNEARQTGNELIRLQKSYAELSERAKRAIKAGGEADDTSSKTLLEMELMTEDFANLRASAEVALGARDELERQLTDQSNENTALFTENGDLRLALEEETRSNEELEATLEVKEEELGQTRNQLSACHFALENECDARQMLEARASALENELAVLREMLHSPMLDGSNVHITLKQRFGSMKRLVHHAYDSPAAVSAATMVSPRPGTSGGLPHPGRSPIGSSTISALHVGGGASLRPGTSGGPGTPRGVGGR